MDRTQLSVVVCGNYGYRTHQIDGQTMKTRVLKDALVDVVGAAQVRVVDSSIFPVSPVRFLYEVRKGFQECSRVVMLPGCRGLQVLLPLFLHWKRKWDRPLHYVVIGGWLPTLLAGKSRLRRCCAELDGIYVETSSMAEKLYKLGLHNVDVLPNFRKFDRVKNWTFVPPGSPLKLVFYSRVIREKGVEEAVAAVQQLNKNCSDGVRVILDIFGPVPGRYANNLKRLLLNSRHVNYRGVLAPDEAYEVLHGYDLLVFPTFYEGEGFPGTLLDACISGLPVIASDWKYNREVVEEGRTGVFSRVHSVDDIVAHVEAFIAHPDRIMKMRQYCLENARNFHVETVIDKLIGAKGRKK